MKRLLNGAPILALLALLLGSSVASADPHNPGLPGGQPTQPNWYQYVNISCASSYYQTTQCQVQGYIQSVQLVQQWGQTPCYYGYNWGYNQYGLWVSNGCSGYFQVQLQGYNPPPPPPPQEISLPTVHIGSKGQSYYCPSSYQGYPFSRAEIAAYHNPQQSYNGCYIPDKSASCSITCFYRQW
jgi:hypothetical protein